LVLEEPGGVFDSLHVAPPVHLAPSYPKLPWSFLPLDSSLPVGGRLSLFWENWQIMGAESWVLRVLREGYSLNFVKLPKLSDHPVCFRERVDPLRIAAKDLIIKEFFQKGAIEVVPLPLGPGFYSSVFLVPKPNGKWRLIINLRPLNKYLVRLKFKMLTTRELALTLEKGMWATSIDLSDAYLHIPIHPQSRKYLRFVHNGVAYQFRALPFGLSDSPCVFTRVINAVVKAAQSQGLLLQAYLDDWLNRGRTSSTVAVNHNWLEHLCVNLGLLVNKDKSEPTPTQTPVFVGILWDLQKGKAFTTESRFAEICSQAQVFLTAKDPIPALVWQQLIGLMVVAEKQVPGGRLRLRPLQLQLNRFFNQFRDNSCLVTVPVSQEVRDALLWWTKRDNVMMGRLLGLVAPQVQMFTDASDWGWGAVLGLLEMKGPWSKEYALQHINMRELRAVWLALQAFLTHVKGKKVQVYSDNCTAVAFIKNQGGTHSVQMFQLVREMLLWCEAQEIVLKCAYIPGKLNLLADRLSRDGVNDASTKSILPTEWCLNPGVVKEIWHLRHRPLVDLFATAANKVLPMYFSPVIDQQALGVDALFHSWEGLDVYAFPPWNMLTQVVRKLERSNCRMILIAPMWERRDWYLSLCLMSELPPLKLGSKCDLLVQGKDRSVWYPDLKVLDLHAWTLCGPLSASGSSQRLSLTEF
jgi:hypothetical protein